MTFTLDSEGFYRPPAMMDFPWLFAGFGTRTIVPPEAELATVKQIHSAEVIRVEHGGPAGTGDALITNTPGVFLAIRTADCIPVLIADARRRAVAAVHAGWRGTAQGIGATALDAMKAAFGTEPEDVRVAIGPGIGKCCYEVGPEVAGAFEGYGNARTNLDLAAINREQLERRGVPGAMIEAAGLCTYCRGEEFFSFRREREQAGRMLSIVGLRK